MMTKMIPCFSKSCVATAALAALLVTGSSDLANAQARRRGAPAAQPGAEGTVAPKQEKQFPLGQSWTAISLNGKSLDGQRPSLQVDENLRGTGFSGCNTFSATTYPLREQNFATGPIALTKRACDQGAAAVEKAFLIALRGARSWDLADGRLIIKGVGGELVFERGI